jgi:hypothetical protein
VAIAERERGLRVECEGAHRADDELVRRLHERAAILGRVKRVAEQEVGQDRLDVVARRGEARGNAANLRRIGIRRDEFAPQLRCHELRRLGARQQEIEHVVAVERRALAEDGLHPSS